VRALRRAAWRSALSVFVSVDGRAIGALLLGDELRRETPRAVQALRNAGVERIVMVTGDRADAAETIGSALDLDAVLADRVPSDKVDAVAVEQRLNPTVMVGDGINDAPPLAKANVGIAMGAGGASASSQAADVVILVDRLDRVSDAVTIAKRTQGIAVQSVVAGMAMSGVAKREDESAVYPRLAKYLSDRHGIGAMSRAHREIIHQAGLLARIADGLAPVDADRYLVRDAQRVIESIEALVRIHNAQEEDIYEHAATT
jgi:soluble P-type ATPase